MAPEEVIIGGGDQIEGIGALAEYLLALERRLLAERPGAVVLAGAGDEALAGALVAAKLLIPIRVLDGGDEPEDPAQAANRRIIDLLARAPA